MVSVATLHDDSALHDVTLTEKVVVESTPETSSASRDEVDRVDIEDPRTDDTALEDDPRTDTGADKTAGEDTATATTTAEESSDMTNDDAQEILNRYGFGAGMRMYARSLALAELEEKQRAAKARAAAEFKAKKEALLLAKEEISPKVLPSVTSVIDFETVRSELSKVVQSIASLGSMDYLNKNKSTNNEKDAAVVSVDKDGDYEDEDDVMEEASGVSRDEIRGQGCCGAEDALNEIFREAEVWAEATYKKMSADQACSSVGTKRSSKKSWWSSFMFQRKNKNRITEKLHLDEGSNAASGSKVAKKNWWESILCAPVILDEPNEMAQATSTPTPVEN